MRKGAADKSQEITRPSTTDGKRVSVDSINNTVIILSLSSRVFCTPMVVEFEYRALLLLCDCLLYELQIITQDLVDEIFDGVVAKVERSGRRSPLCTVALVQEDEDAQSGAGGGGGARGGEEKLEIARGGSLVAEGDRCSRVVTLVFTLCRGLCFDIDAPAVEMSGARAPPPPPPPPCALASLARTPSLSVSLSLRLRPHRPRRRRDAAV
ncbi:hypothetical protein K1T71_014025 [Dendrolimus kikuchii]|uniref:Uncharacterized protein n=1 Tax=Dendrolimus kikuchii TaxID=765133 RepID=A0ACC1CGE7_9NEOP|nr:hypothetical protein K1T71_014025 [Dendrolimus kikuchii]